MNQFLLKEMEKYMKISKKGSNSAEANMNAQLEWIFSFLDRQLETLYDNTLPAVFRKCLFVMWDYIVKDFMTLCYKVPEQKNKKEKEQKVVKVKDKDYSNM